MVTGAWLAGVLPRMHGGGHASGFEGGGRVSTSLGATLKSEAATAGSRAPKAPDGDSAAFGAALAAAPTLLSSLTEHPRDDACSATMRPLAREGRPTEDPRELTLRAERLRLGGVDLRLSRVGASVADVARWSMAHHSPSRIVPKTCADGRMLGVLISDLPSIAPAVQIGLQNGDVITAVNGRALDRPEAVLAAYDSAMRARTAVIEVVRDARPLVLIVSWPAPP